MKLPRLLVLVLTIVLATVVRTPRAHAQAKPDLVARVDTNVVGVGDEFHVTLQASAEGGAVLTDPQLGSSRGITVLGMTSGPSQSITIINGRISQKQGLNATWTVRADKTGSLTIGPASVAVGGSRFATAPLKIQVVAAGQGPRRSQPTDPFASPFGSPFDPFKGLFDFGEPGLQPHDVPVDPKLALEAPLGTTAFLHATVDKTQAVVGEQVTLSVFLYIDANDREPDVTDVHEATADDFVKRPLVDDEQSARTIGNALVAGRLWAVKLVRKSALFPLKTGDLDIGPMTLTLVRARLQGDPHRASEPLRVHVDSPPIAGRPPGYRMGDVGSFNLNAEVTPREVDQDGAVGVTVELSGTGNLPETLTPPARTGVEWLAPEVHEKVGPSPQGGDRFGGKRTFAFVVRMHRPGDIDLGDLTLPFYNPDSKSYGVARATLGAVKVKPGAVPSTQEAQFDPFARLPAPRPALVGTAIKRSHLADTPLFWLGLGGAPLAYAVAAGAWAASQSYRRRRSERKASPETELQQRLSNAEHVCKGGDPKQAYAAMVRVLESATIARAGINVRDARAGEVEERLAGAGVDADAARRFEELLRACELARFSPEAADASLVGERWGRTKAVVQSLRRDA